MKVPNFIISRNPPYNLCMLACDLYATMQQRYCTLTAKTWLPIFIVGHVNMRTSVSESPV